MGFWNLGRQRVTEWFLDQRSMIWCALDYMTSASKRFIIYPKKKKRHKYIYIYKINIRVQKTHSVQKDCFQNQKGNFWHQVWSVIWLIQIDFTNMSSLANKIIKLCNYNNVIMLPNSSGVNAYCWGLTCLIPLGWSCSSGSEAKSVWI